MVTPVIAILSWVAIVCTTCLFFTGVPICHKIWKKKSTEDFTSIPFVMGILSASYWLRYGFLKSEGTIIIVNAVALSLHTLYLSLYYFYTKKKLLLNAFIATVLTMDAAMLTITRMYERDEVIDMLGTACVTFNIICFGAPLAALRVVLRQFHCETLPLPMSIGNFIVSGEWCLYGILTKDIYLITPNAIGLSLATVQLLLFLIFPMKPGSEAAFSKLWKLISKKDTTEPKKAWIPDVISGSNLVNHSKAKLSLNTKSKGIIFEPVVDEASLNESHATEYTEVSLSLSEKSEDVSIPME